ncbi:MAG: polysaccharide biosynthesis/export protein VpsN [Chthoniobacter sp.]|jgi:polysaccharide export outer membrane protein|nr:polysaccharide biosynthesis/export protein VpsN [Chthoniobacter sp.]
MKRFLGGLVFLAAIVFAPSVFAQAVLRPGDVVEIRLSGVPPEEVSQFSAPYTVDDSGLINLPYIGELKAGGLLPNQFQSSVEIKLKADGIYTHPTVTVQQAQTGQRFVSVGGSVRAPGRVLFTPDLTLMSAINAAGGLNDFAKQTAFLTRQGKRVSFDLKKIRKDPSQDPKALPGDQIEVPQSIW